jgi:ribosomal protein S21
MRNKFGNGRSIRGTSIEVKEDFGRALRNWSKKVQESGLMKELKDRSAYEAPSERKQRMKKQARSRWIRQVQEMIENGQWHRDKNF